MGVWHYTTTIIFLALIAGKSVCWLAVKAFTHWSVYYTLVNGILMAVPHDISFVIIGAGEADHA